MLRPDAAPVDELLALGAPRYKSLVNYTLIFPAESFGGPDRHASRQQVSVR